MKDLRVGNTIQLEGSIWCGDGECIVAMLPKSGGRIEGDSFVVAETGERLKIRVLNLSEEGWVEWMRQSDLVETEVMTKTSDGTLAKAIIRKCERQIDKAMTWRCFRRDKYTCVYCGENDVPLTVDHLVTFEMGGPTIDANLATSCFRCNKVRGNMEYSEWLGSDAYARVSKRLTPSQREANVARGANLHNLPRNFSRKKR